MADFRKLRVWQAAQALAIEAYRFSAKMRGARSATLADQLTRAAMSVPTNIVEGSAHESAREFVRFLRYPSPQYRRLKVTFSSRGISHWRAKQIPFRC
jgi:hypothetical protein